MKINIVKRIAWIALLSGAGVAIVSLALGDLGALEIKLILSTIAIGIYSLLALVNYRLITQGGSPVFSRGGVAIVALAFIASFGIIWWTDVFLDDQLWKFAWSAQVVAMAVTFINFLTTFAAGNSRAKFSQHASKLTISVIAAMLAYHSFADWRVPSAFYRSIGIIVVLHCLVTISFFALRNKSKTGTK